MILEEEQVIYQKAGMASSSDPMSFSKATYSGIFTEEDHPTFLL